MPTIAAPRPAHPLEPSAPPADPVTHALCQCYAEVAAMTRAECMSGCYGERPGGCCDHEFCAEAMRHAADAWGVELRPTGHPTIPLMGPNGCIAPPHLRPRCALHACCVTEFGGKPADAAWTVRYTGLVDRIADLEAARHRRCA